MSLIVGIANRIRKIDTPLLVQEMRIRQRGAKPFAVMFFYVAVLSVIALIAVIEHTSRLSPGQAATIGREIFMVLTITQLAMITLIVPAYSAGAVSSEREKRAFELLALTLLPSSTIVTQKLIAALMQVVMLMFTSLPVMCIVFMMGGVSPFEVAMSLGILILSAIMFGAYGVFCSCCFANTRSSTFTTYLSVLAFLIGLPLFGGILRSLAYMGRSSSDTGFLLSITGGFAFGCAVVALVVYACVSPLLKRWFHKHWRSRSFRMVAFGGVYALVTLALGNSFVGSSIVDTLYYQGMFLPMFVHPFVALYSLTENYSYSGGMYVSGGLYAGATPAATMIFATICGYFFRHMSVLKFNALRRSK